MSCCALSRSSWLGQHARSVLSGVGMGADAYVLFGLNTTRAILVCVYTAACSADVGAGGGVDAATINRLGTVALTATVAGQLMFGFAADRIGRRALFVATLVLIALASLLACTLTTGGHVGMGVKLMLCYAILGIGVGGEYPLSAAVSSEGSAGSTAGVMYSLSTVFAMQGVGTLIAAIVATIALSSSLPLDSTWRLCVGLGALPGIATVYCRYHMISDAPRTASSASTPAAEQEAGKRRDTEHTEDESAGLVRAAAAVPPASLISRLASIIRGGAASLAPHAWTLVGTAGNWFLLDVVFYANGLFASQVMRAAGVSAAGGYKDMLRSEAAGSALLAGIAVPGYVLGVVTLSRLGLHRQQLYGFLAMALLYFALYLLAADLTSYHSIFFLLYGCTFAAACWANMTTYVIPACIFPRDAKASCHGISAASGKLGAAFGAALMPMLFTTGGASSHRLLVASEEAAGPAPDVAALRTAMLVCTAVCCAGAVWTRLFTPLDAGVMTPGVANAAAAALPSLKAQAEDADAPVLDLSEGASPLARSESAPQQRSSVGGRARDATEQA